MIAPYGINIAARYPPAVYVAAYQPLLIAAANEERAYCLYVHLLALLLYYALYLTIFD
jgi:hypothetical protein